MHRSLSLNQKEQEKLWSVIKMTKIQPCVLTLTYFFSYIRHALSFCFRITTGKYRWTETHLDLHLRTQDYVQSSSSFLYSDLSSDLKLVPHILLINLTGGKKLSTCTKISKIWIDTNVQKPRWPQLSDGTMKDWILAPVFWRFWREFLNAAAKLSSFVQSQQR